MSSRHVATVRVEDGRAEGVGKTPDNAGFGQLKPFFNSSRP